ncbi:hypothetical protein [Ideonella sp. BN130291]|uniref:hypothetical protein n=1 Tax=Ideonella sp. BN130291 TaxID=3112940 RepID=UPI002E252BB2|nr:hypothetical protein [Ideonella sp. BN130291]
MDRVIKRFIVASCGSALWALATGAQAELADIEWAAGGVAAREFQVAPGKFAEWCGRLARGEKVQWKFEAAAPLNFNVHYHEGKEVRFPAKQDGVTQADGTLDVALDQDYCWMWTNKSSSAVALKARLQKGR